MSRANRLLLPAALMALAMTRSPASWGKAKPAAPVAAKPPAPEGASATTAAAEAEAAPKVKVERGTGGKKIYRITEEIRIEGKIQKPEAFFFYQKSSINYDWQELKQDFVPRILESVNQSPF
jgi:hypothetical protein